MASLVKLFFLFLALALFVGGAGYLLVSSIRLFYQSYRIKTRPILVDKPVHNESTTLVVRPQVEADNSSALAVVTSTQENHPPKQPESTALAVQDVSVKVVGDATPSTLPRSDKEWSAYNEPACQRRPQNQFVWV